MIKAVVLLSGGLDSTTCLALAASKGREIYTVSFDYGQKNRYELELARYNSMKFLVKKHLICKLDPEFFSNSALTNPNIDVPHKQPDGNIPSTYVPARNTVFLSHALALAESIDATEIYIGVNSVDYSGYPDCRPEYIEAFQKMADRATKNLIIGKAKIEIIAPFLHSTKGEIIKTGKMNGVDYSKTLTCYSPIDDKACGKCESCQLRIKGFEEAGIPDETIYY
ncbi:MAG: 7-cyano-7-deazaguanine synthase QueC [Candidatus Delongbacteria bacterium]|nr:7-cyano-7-deazaguanine synthase QueC [Candidatus Delongbacteria bacterium]MBN2834233.1 7-cyano-7-deazaguanine synthase QueC [Candidatus Delongbacteria bacterium]